MLIDTKNMVSMTEANRNFSQVARRVEESGPVVIVKNNKPRFIVMEYSDDEMLSAPDETVLSVARQMMERHRVALRTLAQRA